MIPRASAGACGTSRCRCHARNLLADADKRVDCKDHVGPCPSQLTDVAGFGPIDPPEAEPLAATRKPTKLPNTPVSQGIDPSPGSPRVTFDGIGMDCLFAAVPGAPHMQPLSVTNFEEGVGGMTLTLRGAGHTR